MGSVHHVRLRRYVKEISCVYILYSIHARTLGGMPEFLQLLCHAFLAVCFTRKQGLTADDSRIQRFQRVLARVQFWLDEDTALIVAHCTSPDAMARFPGHLHHEQSPKNISVRTHVNMRNSLFDACKWCCVLEQKPVIADH